MRRGEVRDSALPLLQCCVELRVQDRQPTLLDSGFDSLATPRTPRVLLVARHKFIFAAVGGLRERLHGQLDGHILDALGYSEGTVNNTLSLGVAVRESC